MIKPVWAALALVLSATPALAERIEKNFHETYEVGSKTSLELDSGDGDVILRAWDRAEVQIDVVYIADETRWGLGQRSEFRVGFTQRGDVIQVREADRGGAQVGVQVTNHREYEYSIQAPASLPIVLKGDDGNISIRDWAGALEIQLDDGNLSLDGFVGEQLEIRVQDGEVDLRRLRTDLVLKADDADVDLEDSTIGSAVVEMEDGTLRVRKTEGNFDIEVDDADIQFDAVAIRVLRVRAMDGELDFDARDVTGMDWDIRTDDGDILIGLADGASLDFTIDFDDGDVDLDLPAGQDIERERHRVRGRLAGGEGELRIHTQDGQVRLRQRS